MLSRFIDYVKEQEKLNEKIPTFKSVKHTLFQMYPHFFNGKNDRNVARTYSFAVKAVKKEILQKNRLIRKKEDIFKNPEIMQQIEQDIQGNPDKYLDTNATKTITLILKNRDKAYYKLDRIAQENIMLQIEYYANHNLLQNELTGILKSHLAHEILQEYNNMVEEIKNADGLSEEKRILKKNNAKLDLFARIKEGIFKDKN